MNRVIQTAGLAAVLSVMFSGCGPGGTAPTNIPANPPSTSAGTASRPAWMLAEAPINAIGVAQIKADAKEGDQVVMRGRIGGRADPISEGSPVMILMEPSIPSCAENPADSCRTPWDYCCEPAEVKAANNATVQVVDQAGQPVGESIASAGLSPLDEVIVVGTVGPRPEASVLTILATGVYRIR